MKTGLKYESVATVGDGNTAVSMGSGDLPVFATPSMAALMENAAMNAVAGYLPDGATTVGTEISVSHVKSSPVGARITASAELVEVDGRRLVFAVRAWDERGMIGEGSHIRFIVDRERFMSKS